MVLRPVWDWGEQFSDKDIALFSNPLYKKPLSLEQDPVPDGGIRKSRIPAGALLMPGAEDLRQQFGDNLSVARHQHSARLSRNIQLMRINTSDVSDNVSLRFSNQLLYTPLPLIFISGSVSTAIIGSRP